MQLSKIFFNSPEPAAKKTRIWPVFLPYMGCPGHCLYCNQDLQTSTKSDSLKNYYHNLHTELEKAYQKKTRDLELGFFGGTFTALPGEWAIHFLDLVESFRQKGLISKIRCSTRPDSINAVDLNVFRKHGLDLVEIGAQSFADKVLLTSGRRYTYKQIIQASNLIKEAGLKLGLQLLPGLPGHNLSLWQEDILQTCSLNPDVLRIYPCLVLKNTPLARLWEKGHYKPWSLKTTIQALCLAVQSLWKKNIPIIRMGLAPEQSLVQNILAGPWHPALGNMVKSHVLFAWIRYHALLLKPGAKRLFLPQSHSGEIYGYQGKFVPGLQQIGASKTDIINWKYPFFLMQQID